jgi:hypothetical protein
MQQSHELSNSSEKSVLNFQTKHCLNTKDNKINFLRHAKASTLKNYISYLDSITEINLISWQMVRPI